MCLGLIGLFRILLSRERRSAHYLAAENGAPPKPRGFDGLAGV